MTSNTPSEQELKDKITSALSNSTTTDITTGVEAVALAVHASLVSSNFTFAGLASGSEATGDSKLPERWNDNSHHVSLSYAQPGSDSKKIIVTTTAHAGVIADVSAVSINNDDESGQPKRGGFSVRESSINLTLPAKLDPSDTTSGDLYKDGELAEIYTLTKSHIVDRFTRGSSEGSSIGQKATTESAAAAAAASSSQQPGQEEPPLRQPASDQIQPNPTYPSSLPRNPDLPSGPRQPHRPPVPGETPPGFEDPYDIHRPPGRSQNPLQEPGRPLGHDDLYPAGMGPNDPVVPFFGGRGGISDPRMGRPGGHGGMHPTFDDPLFGGTGSGNGQGQGGDPMAPPGARYDPFGPDDPRGGWPDMGADRRGHGDGSGPFGGPGGFGGGMGGASGGFGGGGII